MQKLLESNENKLETVIKDRWQFLHSPISKYSPNITELNNGNKDNDFIKVVLRL